jgi:hypothetical protein
MGIDKQEVYRRGQGSKKENNHPYAAIQHRILDSAAWADLSFSSRALLVQIARKLTRENNNGHLEAAYSYLARFGYSDSTVTRGITDLVTHGFLFRTKRGGYNRGTSRFAVTWLKLSDNKEGISPQGFRMDAWRDWQPTKKMRPSNSRSFNPENEGLTTATTPFLNDVPSFKNRDSVLVPVYARVARPPPDCGAWLPAYLNRLAAHGPQFRRACSVEAPPWN